MAFQPCPGIAQFEMVYADDTQVVENVYHMNKGSAWAVADLQTVITALEAWETAQGRGARDANCSLFKVMARDLSSSSGAELELAVTPPIAGQGVTGDLPNNVTLAIKANSGLAGRSNRGRTYWIGLPRNFVVGQSVSAAAGTQLVTAMQALLTSLNGLGLGSMCILSRRTGGAPRANGVGVAIIGWVLTDFTVDSQRRRLPGHNVHH